MQEFMEERPNEMEINIQELLITYIRKWWVIVLCVVLTATITLVGTIYFVTPMYRAGITVYVNNNRLSDDQDKVTSSDLSAAIHLVKSYMSIAESDCVLEKVASRLNNDYTAGQLRSAIMTEQIKDTEIFGIYVVHADPHEAARIADAIAEIAPEEIQNVIVGTAAKVIDRAKVPTGRYSPSYTRNAVLGGAVGLLLALVYLTILHLKDNRIKDENDLTEMFQLPILGRIPVFEGSNRSGYKAE